MVYRLDKLTSFALPSNILFHIHTNPSNGRPSKKSVEITSFMADEAKHHIISYRIISEGKMIKTT